MKKIFLIFVLAFLSFGITATAATVSVLDAGGRNGDKIDVYVMLEGSDVVGGQMDTIYDGEVLSLIRATVDSSISSAAFVNTNIENTVKLSWLLKTEVPDGELCKLRFKVNTSNAVTTNINIQNAKLTNFEAKAVECKTVPGKFYINTFAAEMVFLQDGVRMYDTFGNGDITYKTVMKNYTNSTVNAAVYVATYEGDKLLTVKKTESSLLSLGKKETEYEDIDVGGNVTKIKAFV